MQLGIKCDTILPRKSLTQKNIL